ncbi:hypothetical protein SAMN04488048_11528 [Trichococcus flocculiformis]|jgi:AAA15 family ATPase/GTPase|uniref:AAA family ATPase n=1 Tax=Trichococcus TaxID=82802 RepID=UPI0007A88E27|nr:MULTISPECIES: ATP-binding protein [Trichococcus]NBL00108.1 ATP-binding protein [Erysipelotrichia bacterium]CZR05892.1 atpase aaa-type core [Trichococcus sp. ES5]SHF88167.1 hypothetical protein SAMN04488048_11528 [Trichococcus flocculiformis]
MLLEFKVKNFLSFKDEQIFSMVASNLTELPENRIEVSEGDLYLLKSASIFGANASGKSNLLAGISFMRGFILNSVKDSQDEGNIANISFALNTEYQKKNTEFELTFLHNDLLVRYGFEIGKKKVDEEWLYIDEELVFLRKDSILAEFSIDYIKEDEAYLKFSMTNEKSLFLTILSTTNTKFAEIILDFFRNNINVINGLGISRIDFTKRMIKDGDKKFKEQLLEMLKVADFNINNLEVKESKFQIQNVDDSEIPEEILNQLKLDTNRLLSEHNVYDAKGEIVGIHKFDSEVFESSGTNEFLKIAGPIIDTLQHGKILFIDEIDAQLHPLMTRYILELFNSEHNNSGQLIITSHNSTILDNELQRRDQIWFAEKDILEASHLTSLANYRFKGEVVRKDEKYEKNYLRGKYGAIPFIKPYSVENIFHSNSEEF